MASVEHLHNHFCCRLLEVEPPARDIKRYFLDYVADNEQYADQTTDAKTSGHQLTAIHSGADFLPVIGVLGGKLPDKELEFPRLFRGTLAQLCSPYRGILSRPHRNSAFSRPTVRWPCHPIGNKITATTAITTTYESISLIYSTIMNENVLFHLLILIFTKKTVCKKTRLVEKLVDLIKK